jgi:hypothetical protein
MGSTTSDIIKSVGEELFDNTGQPRSRLEVGDLRVCQLRRRWQIHAHRKGGRGWAEESPDATLPEARLAPQNASRLGRGTERTMALLSVGCDCCNTFGAWPVDHPAMGTGHVDKVFGTIRRARIDLRSPPCRRRKQPTDALSSRRELVSRYDPPCNNETLSGRRRRAEWIAIHGKSIDIKGPRI